MKRSVQSRRCCGLVVPVCVAASLMFLGIFLLASVALSAAPVTITIAANANTDEIAYIQRLADLFVAKNTNTKIEVIPASFNNVQVLLASGVALDMIGFSGPNWTDPLARANTLEDLTQYIQRDGRQFEDWYPASFNDYRWRGGMFGIPMELQLLGLFYNADVFNESGLALPNDNWTYDDLRANSLKITRRDADNKIVRWGFMIPGIPSSRNWVPIIWAFGGDLFDDWSTPTRFTGNTTEVANALNYLFDLVRSGAARDEAATAAKAWSAAWADQSGAMFITNTISMRSFTPIKDFVWDVAPVPKGPAGRIPFIASRGWNIMRNSKNKEVAWSLLKYFTSPEALRLYVETFGILPPSRTSIVKDWMVKVQAPKNREVFFRDIEHAKAPWPITADVFNPVSKAVEQIVWGKKSAAIALATVEEQMKVTLAELNR